MLYEVITVAIDTPPFDGFGVNVDVPQALDAAEFDCDGSGGTASIRLDDRPGGWGIDYASPDFSEPDRITSYNVCYTKLLRKATLQLQQRYLLICLPSN